MAKKRRVGSRTGGGAAGGAKVGAPAKASKSSGLTAMGPLAPGDLARSALALNIRPTVELARLRASVDRIRAIPTLRIDQMAEDRRASFFALKPDVKRFHGAKVPLTWFPWPLVGSPCADMFGYMSSAAVRSATRLPFNAITQALMNQLGDLMGDPGRDVGPNAPGDSSIPAGFTYVGQFVDHDITLDVSSSLEAPNDANAIHNMRTPRLDLDSVYGRGPALEPYLYAFPPFGAPNPSAIKMQLGTNTNTGAGGPGGTAGMGGMVTKTDFDVPRTRASNTAIVGDPRNDENLIVSQFHQTMLRFHNQVVDLLQLASFAGDIFVEAKKIVTHHYQWAVVKDFLKILCGEATVDAALAGVVAPINSAFRMPVEFAVAAYRLGHSMIRDTYWVNFNFPDATLGQVFEFIRNPRLPVFSNWVVDFNAFFDTGVAVPIHNKARPIDSVLASGLETLPGFSGLAAILARRNLRRGLAMGLPSGQGMAGAFGVPALTTAEITKDLPANEVAILNSNGGLLLQRTPLWYYVLREAWVANTGNQLGPVGGRIVAETFVRMLKRDGDSYLNVPGGFVPFLPSVMPGKFTLADLVIFAGVTQP